MGKEKQGKPNHIPSPVTKAADKKKQKERERQKEEEKQRGDKPKLPPKSGLGPTPSTAPLLSTTKPMTWQTPMKRSAMMSPEGAPLYKNPRIDPITGVPKTIDTEKKWIKELLAGRGKGKDPKSEESGSDEESKKEATPQRTSRD